MSELSKQIKKKLFKLGLPENLFEPNFEEEHNAELERYDALIARYKTLRSMDESYWSQFENIEESEDKFLDVLVGQKRMVWGLRMLYGNLKVVRSERYKAKRRRGDRKLLAKRRAEKQEALLKQAQKDVLNGTIEEND